MAFVCDIRNGKKQLVRFSINELRSYFKQKEKEARGSHGLLGTIFFQVDYIFSLGTFLEKVRKTALEVFPYLSAQIIITARVQTHCVYISCNRITRFNITAD